MYQPLLKSFIQYTGVGALATVAHYAVFLALMNATPAPAWLATLIAASIGAVLAYLLNYHYTFASDAEHAEVMPKFLAVAALSVIMQTAIVAVLNQHWHLHYLLAQLVATGFGLVFTFLINRFWTFHDRH